MKINTLVKLKEAFKNNVELFYSTMKIVEIKRDRIRTEGCDLFFVPWLPAITTKQYQDVTVKSIKSF